MFRYALALTLFGTGAAYAQAPTIAQLEEQFSGYASVGMTVSNLEILEQYQDDDAYITTLRLHMNGNGTYYLPFETLHDKTILTPMVKEADFTPTLQVLSYYRGNMPYYEFSFQNQEDKTAIDEWRKNGKPLDKWAEDSILYNTEEYTQWVQTVEAAEETYFADFPDTFTGQANCRNHSWKIEANLNIDRTSLGAINGTISLFEENGEAGPYWTSNAFLDTQKTLTVEPTSYGQLTAMSDYQIPTRLILEKTDTGWTGRSPDGAGNNCTATLIDSEDKEALDSYAQTQATTTALANEIVALSSCSILNAPVALTEQVNGKYKLSSPALSKEPEITLSQNTIELKIWNTRLGSTKLANGTYVSSISLPITFDVDDCPFTLHSQESLEVALAPLYQERDNLLETLEEGDVIVATAQGSTPYIKWGDKITFTIQSIEGMTLKAQINNLERQGWAPTHDVNINLENPGNITLSGVSKGNRVCDGSGLFQDGMIVITQTQNADCPRFTLRP